MSAEYEETFGTAPDQKELADLLGVTPETMRSIILAASTPVSIDDKIKYSKGSSGPSEGRSLADVIPDTTAAHPGDRLDKEKIIQAIQRSLHTLSEREEKIIRLRFGISEEVTDHTEFPITNKELSNIKKESSTIK